MGLDVDFPQGVDATIAEMKFEALTEDELRQGFWCASHDLSVVYEVSDAEPTNESQTLQTGSPTLLAVLHTDAVSYADPEGRVKWASRFSSLIDFLRYLREHQNEEWILYFFCHAEENKLFIRSDSDHPAEQLVPQRLMNYLESDSYARKRGVVFLNGCKTGVSNRSYSWQQATRYRGLAGYIGTEAIIPTRFAWNFGNDLLYLLASGSTPESAMRQLRKRHWPLSLLYGMYCIPDAAVVSVPISTSFRIPSSTNYCASSLGSGDNLHATLPFADSGTRETPIRRRGAL